MRTVRSSDRAVEAVVGYAADARGGGLAYARLTNAQSKRLLRVPFRLTAQRSQSDRAIGYAALTAVSQALRKRGVREACFVLGDSAFVQEIATGRGVEETLALPYVRLRCALNALEKFDVRAGCADDLTQRARAEVALNVAA